jgi:hypothetical protein
MPAAPALQAQLRIVKSSRACHAKAMTADVTLEGGARLTAHAMRAAVLGEVHARPFTAIAKGLDARNASSGGRSASFLGLARRRE